VDTIFFLFCITGIVCWFSAYLLGRNIHTWFCLLHDQMPFMISKIPGELTNKSLSMIWMSWDAWVCVETHWTEINYSFVNNLLGPAFKMFSWSQMSSLKSKDLYVRVHCMLRISQSIRLLNLLHSLHSPLETWVLNLYHLKWLEDRLDSGILYTKAFTLTSMCHLNSPRALAIKSSRRGMCIDDVTYSFPK
jgi:hypothetical protein